MTTVENTTGGPVALEWCAAPGCGSEGHEHRWRSFTLPVGAFFTYDAAAENGDDIAAQTQNLTVI